MKTKVGVVIYQSVALFKALGAHHKILTLLKGHFVIYKKQLQHLTAILHDVIVGSAQFKFRYRIFATF